MPNKVVEELIRAVAALQADMQWIKKYVWISVSASMTAALGILGQIIHFLLKHAIH